MAAQIELAVVGGGIVGLSTALAGADGGLDVRVPSEVRAAG